MADEFVIRPIAHIVSDFDEKFGIPRQSGLVEELEALVVFEPEYRIEAALRGLEGFSHIWLIWQFSRAVRGDWSPTVRPPRLGGNTRMGVFATRSPFRPNPLGLSCVGLRSIETDRELGPVLRVTGADLLSGTPIYDIKPYLPYADCRPDARGGFASGADGTVSVRWSEGTRARAGDKADALEGVLAQDPRPSYQDDPQRVYGMRFASLEIKFTVDGDVLTVVSVEKA